MQCSAIDLVVIGNCQNLGSAIFQNSTKLDMAASLGEFLKSKSSEDLQNVSS